MRIRLLASAALALTLAAAPALAQDKSHDHAAPTAPAKVQDKAQPKGGPLTEDDVRRLVEQYIVEHPEVIVQSVDAHFAKQRAEAERAANEAVDRLKPELLSADGLPFIGSPDGKIVIAYFFDANCTYCKKVEGPIFEVAKSNPDVKVVFRQMPILADSSRYAAMALTAAHEAAPAKYAELHSAVLRHEGQLTNQAVDGYVEKVLGADARKVLDRLADAEQRKALTASVNRNIDLANKAGATGTPFIYLDGNPVRGAVPKEALQQMVESVRARLAK